MAKLSGDAVGIIDFGLVDESVEVFGEGTGGGLLLFLVSMTMDAVFKGKS